MDEKLTARNAEAGTPSGTGASATPGAAASAGASGGAALLSPADVSLFCEGMAMMLSAGIQVDEALGLLDVGRSGARLSAVCDQAFHIVSAGGKLSDALRATGAFPRHALDMMAVGERTGKLEQTLQRLTNYYDEEARVFAKIRTAVGYPAALLCVMSVVVAFAVWVVLPVFADVYEGLAGGLTAGSSAWTVASTVIGWAALIITVLGAVATLAAALACRTPRGNVRLRRALERLPFTRKAMAKLALSRFTMALSTLLSSGVSEEDALRESLATVENPLVRQRVRKAMELMDAPDFDVSMPAALADAGLIDPLYSRMLTVGGRTGKLEDVLSGLGQTLFDEAADGIDRIVDTVEPLLAALLTVAVGATLIAVMLPLIGMMGSIG